MTRGLFISFLFFFCHCGFAQVKITYQVTYKPDSTNDTYNVEEMTLHHFENKSYFFNETKFKLDSIYDKVTVEYLRTGISPNVSLKYELNFGVYKNFSKQELYEIQNINSRNYIYNIDFKKLDWKIVDEEKIIHDYICKKATVDFGGRIWEAWFTTQIPINDGPYKFFGLPGLILEIYDVQNHYHFLPVRISKIDEKVILPSSFIKTSQENFTKLQEKIVKDPALFVRESVMRSTNVQMKGTDGNVLYPSELYDRITKEFNNFIKTHNNPIEKQKLWMK